MHARLFSDVGLKVKGYLDQGQLVPDNVMVDLFLDEISSIANSSFLLDGKKIARGNTDIKNII